MEEVKYIWKRMSNNNNEMVKESVSLNVLPPTYLSMIPQDPPILMKKR